MEPLIFLIGAMELGSTFDKALKSKREGKKVKKMLDRVDEYAKQTEHLIRGQS